MGLPVGAYSGVCGHLWVSCSQVALLTLVGLSYLSIALAGTTGLTQL